MSTPDTMTSLTSMPWMDASGKALAVRSLPGLDPEVIQTLKSAYPGLINPPIQALLASCCGLADTDLGHLDFTGCCFPEEPCAVFQPCLTLAIDDAGRRWIAELGDSGLPGPVWCVFPDPEVAVHISHDLQGFVATLHEHAHRGQTLTWLRDLTATARAVWVRRRALARRPYGVHDSDADIRGWLSSLPPDAYVYDLRRQSAVRGWPYGVAGPSGRLYRCGRLPVFAAAAAPTEGWRAGRPDRTSPIHPIAALSLDIAASDVPTSRRRPRSRPETPPWRTRRGSRNGSGHWPAQNGPAMPAELRICA
jgi:hypothetical protein